LPSAATTNIVDIPRQVYFMAKLLESPRVRAIGTDQVIRPLLRAEADRQLSLGWITQASHDYFYSKVAAGSGWPLHFHHIHLSLNWWGSAKPGAEADGAEGCGIADAPADLPTKDVPKVK